MRGMPRLREPQRFRARVLAPTWVSPGRAALGGTALLGLVVGVLSLGGVLPAVLELAFWAVPVGLGGIGLLQGQRRWVEAELEVEEGQVTIQGAGPGVDTLRARSVRALSTASGVDGVVLAVNPGGVGLGARSPVLIQVDDLAQADTLCDALAVGSRGLGALEWFPQEEHGAALHRNVSWLLLIASLFGIFFWFVGVWRQPMPELAAVGAVFLQGLVILSVDRRKIRMDRLGVDLNGLGVGWGYVPYAYIEEVRCSGASLELILSPPYPAVELPAGKLKGLSPEEIAHLADQLRSASLRARGLGRPERDPELAFDELRRGEDSVSRWLHRLETQASAMQSGAYRSEGHNTSELWEALDDHDAPPEVRVAAARVLLRVQPEQTRSRVAELARDQREPATREALELAAEEQDLEELARRLEDCGLWAEAATGDRGRAS